MVLSMWKKGIGDLPPDTASTAAPWLAMAAPSLAATLLASAVDCCSLSENSTQFISGAPRVRS